MQYAIESIPDNNILVDGEPVTKLQVTREDGLVVTVNNPDHGYILEAFRNAAPKYNSNSAQWIGRPSGIDDLGYTYYN